MHRLLSRLVTPENVGQLGFVSVEEGSALLEKAFMGRDAAAMRAAIVLGQWIVLSQAFGIPRAMPETASTLRKLLVKFGLETRAMKIKKWTISNPALVGAMQCALKYIRLMY